MMPPCSLRGKCGSAASLRDLHSLDVETDECLAAQPLAFMGDDAICKITTSIKKGETSLDRRMINFDIFGRDQRAEHMGELPPTDLEALDQHPGEFAQGRQGQGDELCSIELRSRQRALDLVIVGNGANQYVRVSDDLHSSPAQPFPMISFISSMLIGLRPSRFNMPKTSEIFPLGCIAWISMRPSGSFSTATRSPGCNPRCLSKSFLRVIWPLVVMVSAFIAAILSTTKVRHYRLTFKFSLLLLVTFLSAEIPTQASAAIPAEQAKQAAIHPVATSRELTAWLARVPLTREFPSDLNETLRSENRMFVIEMSSAPGCVPCGDLWAKLLRFSRAYGWQVRTISSGEALLRSGRLGLPWVGHPVLWVRPAADKDRLVPAAIGTDHDANLRRNIYLSTKLLTGVRPEIGLRAMSKYTGIVAPSVASTTLPKRKGS